MVEVKEDVRDKIYSDIINQGRKLTWVSKETGINYNTLYAILVQKIINLSDDNKKLLSSVLDKKY